MAAPQVDQLPEGDAWVYELKLNGSRYSESSCIIPKRCARVRLPNNVTTSPLSAAPAVQPTHTPRHRLQLR
jgi:hypothetical protein